MRGGTHPQVCTCAQTIVIGASTHKEDASFLYRENLIRHMRASCAIVISDVATLASALAFSRWVLVACFTWQRKDVESHKLQYSGP